MIEFLKKIFKAWFPGGVNVKTPFGWDPKTVPGVKRFHLAQDYAPYDGHRETTLAHTVIDGHVKWLIYKGCSILRQFAEDVEVRYYHLHHEELTSDILAALLVPGAIVPAGTVIGPSGNVGLSVAGKGNDGSHVHICFVFDESAVDLVAEIVGPGWDTDASADCKKQYGVEFEKIKKNWGVKWFNDRVIYRYDDISKKYAYFVNPKCILGA